MRELLLYCVHKAAVCHAERNCPLGLSTTALSLSLYFLGGAKFFFSFVAEVQLTHSVNFDRVDQTSSRISTGDKN
jgi:hypothetical protein